MRSRRRHHHPPDSDLAADGVDEVIEVFLKNRDKARILPVPCICTAWTAWGSGCSCPMAERYALPMNTPGGMLLPVALLRRCSLSAGRGPQIFACHGDAALLDAWGSITP